MPCAYSAISSIVFTCVGSLPSAPTHAPFDPRERLGRGVERHAGEQLRLRADLLGRADDRGRRAVGRARVVAVADAEPVGVGGDDLDVERRDAELVGDELRVLRLLPVGLGGQAEHHLAGRVHAQEDRPVRLVQPSLSSPLGWWLCGLARAAGAPGGRSARCAPPGRRTPAAGRRAGAAARRAARSPGRCRSSVASSLIGHPARRRVAPARAVAARHRDRAARDRRGARPRLGLRRRGGAGARRRSSHARRRSPRRPRASASKLWPLTSASQYGSAATMPPACTENASALTRGLTQTIRWASRARRCHLAPDEHRVAALPAVGEDHDHRAARHAAAAVAVVELLQRVADPRPARPVGRGRGRALDRALRVARGERARQARQPRREDERLGVRPAAGGAGQELQVGARVRLHRAGDVAQQHEPPRRRCAGAAARGGSDRRRCAGCARSVRRMSMRSPWRPFS